MSRVHKKILFLSVISVIVTVATFTSCDFFTAKVAQSISVIDSYSEIKDDMKQWGKDTLVLFDVDKTLYYAETFLIRYGKHPKGFLEKLHEKFPAFKSREKWGYYKSIILAQDKRTLVEDSIPEVFVQLKKQGCTLIGLTTMRTGRWGVIKSVPEWRYQSLIKVGLEFSQKFKDHVFKQFEPSRSHYPQLYKGILATNLVGKDQLLKAFLAHTNIKPNRIVFFDDHQPNVHKVAKVCEEKNIAYQGFHYLGEDEIPVNRDHDKLLKQFDHLLKHEKWLSLNELDNVDE